MSEDIKSALEIALEKAAAIEKATPEEKLQWQHVPEGERLAVKYLKEDVNLLVELNHYQEDIRKYIHQGVEDVLIRNIALPKDEGAKKANRKAMDGLKILKRDKVAVENVLSKIRRLYSHYSQQGEQQKKDAYAALKMEFATKMQEAMRQQMGTTEGYHIDVERQPQFQEEWRRLQARLEGQYTKVLDEYKQELRAIQ